LIAERHLAGQARGVARLARGDGAFIEVEMTSRIFREDGAEERTCTILRDITERVAMERELGEMSERLRQLALTDELTGLRNRRGLLAVASHMLEMADRQSETIQLLYLDVDNMKEINDYLGHTVGDIALRAVAGALSQVVRHADVVSRIGGDEFVALMLGLADSERKAIEQRIQEFLHSARTIAVVGRPVAVSVGWASRSPFGSACAEELMVEADRAMYKEKCAKDSRSTLTTHGNATLM